MSQLLQEEACSRIDGIGRKKGMGEIEAKPSSAIREFDSLVDEGRKIGQLFTRST